MLRYAAKHGWKGVEPICKKQIIEHPRRFRALIDAHKDKWVLQDGVKPVFESGWCDLVLEIFFYVLNTFYKVKIAQVASAFDLEGNTAHKKDWCGIMSHICYELGNDTMTSLIPGHYIRYNKLIGAGTCHRIDTSQELARLEGEIPDERHTWGYLYAVNNGMVYDPEALLNHDDFFWEKPLSTHLVNDCAIHTINYVFRHPIFVLRQQVHRLAQVISKKKN